MEGKGAKEDKGKGERERHGGGGSGECPVPASSDRVVENVVAAGAWVSQRTAQKAMSPLGCRNQRQNYCPFSNGVADTVGTAQALPLSLAQGLPLDKWCLKNCTRVALEPTEVHPHDLWRSAPCLGSLHTGARCLAHPFPPSRERGRGSLRPWHLLDSDAGRIAMAHCVGHRDRCAIRRVRAT